MADDFGTTLDEMDTEAFFNMRDWLQEAIEAKGGKITGKWLGMGKSDLWVDIDGAPFFIQISPCTRE